MTGVERRAPSATSSSTGFASFVTSDYGVRAGVRTDGSLPPGGRALAYGGEGHPVTRATPAPVAMNLVPS